MYMYMYIVCSMYTEVQVDMYTMYIYKNFKQVYPCISMCLYMYISSC